MKTFITRIIFLSFLLPFSYSAIAAIINVNNTSDGNDATAGNGVCETAAGNNICTLRAAISEANALAGADVINVPTGTYNIGSTLSVYSELTIMGANTATTIIDAKSTARVFLVSNIQPILMSNFTITGGNAGSSGGGGGIALSSNVDLTLSNMNINNNSANTGAGISSGSTVNQLNILNSVIENNSGIENSNSSMGGGLSLSTGTFNITDTTIRNNSATFGGGIFFMGSTLTLRNSTITGNTSTVLPTANGGYGGGGIHVGSGSSATFTAINSTISGNKAFTHGAGILIFNGTASLYNTTVTNNTADFNNSGIGSGGGIDAFGTTGSRILNMSNSIIAGNHSSSGNNPDCSSANLLITSFGYNIIGDISGCSFVKQTGDQVGNAASQIDVKLAVLADNGGSTLTHAILEGSPAIDTGNPANCNDHLGNTLTTDQRGVPRALDGGTGNRICDPGSYERRGIYGSGGCTLNRDAKFDPLFPLMLLIGFIYLWRRRENGTNEV